MLVAAVLLPAGASALPGTTERVSLDSFGGEGNNDSNVSAITGDGRFVAVVSSATNLVGDTNGALDVFVRDRQTGTTEMVSVDSGGVQGNSDSYYPDISDDGRFVAFSSFATNLVAGDTNGVNDVFVHDRQAGVTTRVSVDGTGAEANSTSGPSVISSDGRFVAFLSFASNLVTGDTNGTFGVFTHDRQTGATTRVSVDSAGVEGNSKSVSFSHISGDGRFVAFSSFATNLVARDTNCEFDVFVHDRDTDLDGIFDEAAAVSMQACQNLASRHSVSRAACHVLCSHIPATAALRLFK